MKAGLTISPRVRLVMMSAVAELLLVLERWSNTSQFVVCLQEGVGHALMMAAVTSSSEIESTFLDSMMIVLVG